MIAFRLAVVAREMSSRGDCISLALKGMAAVVIACTAAACVTVDHNMAASLGTAGVQATQALSSQASGAVQTLGELGQWWGVHDTLVCVNVPKADAKKACIAGATSLSQDPSLKQLIDVLTKSKQATNTLNQAYSAFVDLAHYNAGQATTAALKTSFADINSFLSAASALPGAAALPPISTTMEKATAGVVALVADNRQNAQILASNKDLQSANDALYGGLSAESKAITSILLTLQQERQALYQSGFDAGLIDPTDILTPVFAEAYPGLRLQRATAENRDVVKAAAQNVLTLQSKQIDAAITSSYAASLSTLHALSIQHQKFANGESLNVGQIQAEVSNLKSDISQMSSSATSSTEK